MFIYPNFIVTVTHVIETFGVHVTKIRTLVLQVLHTEKINERLLVGIGRTAEDTKLVPALLFPC